VPTHTHMAKKKNKTFKLPKSALGELIDEFSVAEGANMAVLEPREWYDHAIVDVVQDPSDWSYHVVYDRVMLVYWHTLMSLYQLNKYKTFRSLENGYANADEHFHDGCVEYVEYNCIRGMAYAGHNKPLIRPNLVNLL
jgi:hypothetical protein